KIPSFLGAHKVGTEYYSFSRILGCISYPTSKSYNSWFSLFIHLTLSHSLDKGRPNIPSSGLLGFIVKCSIRLTPSSRCRLLLISN
ncbi:MAG: hypothetical protein WAZ77_16420, partial [Candidatus Nitrosopolaris sp.]